MKVKHIKDLDKFFEVIDNCTDKVELIGPDIRLNLKSKLAQMLSLAQIFSSGNEVEELEIIAYNQDDVMALINYLAEMRD